MLVRANAKSKTRPDASLRRVVFVAAFIIFWMAAISVRLVYVQVSMHDAMAERARKQQQGSLEISPERGQVSDREGRELARSIDSDSIYVAPDEVGDADTTAARLAEVLGLDEAKVFRQLNDAKAGSKFVWIARRIPHEQAEQIEGMKLAGVHARKEPKRFYPNGRLAAHVLGFVGLDNNGHAGIEQFYNQKISGEGGRILLEADSLGRAYESFERPSKPGQSVVLTLDQMTQFHAEEALNAALLSSHAQSGTVVVLDPHTGEILALANAPSFDPNDPGKVKPEARVNHALEYVYEPGSTFKIVAYSAAIEKGLAKPDDKIDCQMGQINVFGRVVHDHHPFGVLTLSEALAKSSNVGAIKLGMRVGDPSMYDFIKRYGFGDATGVELPSESVGTVRPLKRWQASSIGSIAMGQEISVTPLQMAAAFATLANGGVRIAPHIVREVRNAAGVTVYLPNPEQRRVISANTANALKGMLEGVTLNGTAKKAQLNGYSAAGKTGTAQKFDPKIHGYSLTKYVASFVGFAPVENPAVVIVVVIDEPAGSHHGGDVAAPVFRAIAEQILPEMGIAPDSQLKITPELLAMINHATMASQRSAAPERQAQTPAPPREIAHRAGRDGEIVYTPAIKNSIVMPDLRGRSVRDVAVTCGQLGLQIEAHGDGRVWRQSPAAGAEVTTGQMVYIDFGRAN
jgi:cell division protein FtsI (penicillin-binding protein 3)